MSLRTSMKTITLGTALGLSTLGLAGNNNAKAYEVESEVPSATSSNEQRSTSYGLAPVPSFINGLALASLTLIVMAPVTELLGDIKSSKNNKQKSSQLIK